MSDIHTKLKEIISQLRKNKPPRTRFQVEFAEEDKPEVTEELELLVSFLTKQLQQSINDLNKEANEFAVALDKDDKDLAIRLMNSSILGFITIKPLMDFITEYKQAATQFNTTLPTLFSMKQILEAPGGFEELKKDISTRFNVNQEGNH